jgi:hypothetical protein
MPYCVVAYDIPDDRRRLCLSRVLWGMLDRVQKSIWLEERRVDWLAVRGQPVTHPGLNFASPRKDQDVGIIKCFRESP